MQIRSYALLAAFWVFSAMQVHVIAQPVQSSSDYHFQHYNTKDGLANEFNWNIEQDSLGFIWVFYSGGMSRFDGYNFKIYKYDPEDSLRSNLNFLPEWPVKDHNNNLWFTQHMNVGPKHILAHHDRRTDGFIKYEIDLGGEWPKGAWALHKSRSFEKDGSLVWIGSANKGLFSYNFKTGETKNYLNLDPEGKPSRPLTISGIKDLGSSLLLATGFGIWIFDKTTKSYSRPVCRPGDTTFLYQNPVQAIVESPHVKEKFIWLKLPQNLVKIDSAFSVVQTFEFPIGVTMEVVHCSRDREGVFWFAGAFNSNTGLFRFDSRDSSIVNIKHDPGDPRSLASNYVLGVMVDVDQNVWVGGDRGVSVLRRQDIKFYNTKVDDGILCANTIYKSASGEEYLILGKRQLGSSNNQLYIAPIFPKRLDSINLKPILEPMEGIEIQGMHKGKHFFWVSSIGSGVIGYPIDPKTGMIVPRAEVRLRHDPQNVNTIRTDNVHYVWEDPDEDLWVGNVNGSPNRVRRDIPYGEDGSVLRYGSEFKGQGPFFNEGKNSFLMRWSEGIYRFHLPADAKGNDRFEQVTKYKYKPRTMSASSDGTLLIGTSRGLYTAPKVSDQLYKISETPLLRDIDVMAIQEDQIGRWWTYGGNRVTCFDRSDSTTTVFDMDDGLDHFRCQYQNWFLKTSVGIFVVVSPEGVSLFDPNTFLKGNRKISPVLTHLSVNNSPVAGRTIPFDPDFSIPSDISALTELVLDYLHNNFTIEFSAMEMTAPEKNLYKHKLEGYDNDWIETDFRNRTATYTNLPAGDYIFKVKASNHHGVWSDQEKTLKVKILPPPWRTWWAYTAYGLLISGMLIVARRMVVQRERLKSNLKLEHLQLEKVQEIDKVKTNFFANISHEFRTPLTLIKGPVQNLLEQFKKDKEAKAQLSLIQQNSERLLRLVNQMLELARAESGILKKEIAEGDITSFLKMVVGSFSLLAVQKNITLLQQIPDQVIRVRFDQDKVEKIVSNLIANAMKFTPQNGSVSIHAFLMEEIIGIQNLTLHVTDTGKGVPPDHMDKIFERFYQVSEDGSQSAGTGIGLALSKELTEFLGGTLTVESNVGQGTRFTLTLPVEVLEISESVTSESLSASAIAEGEVVNGYDVKSNGVQTEGLEKPLLLIVEDHVDLRKFIIACLGNDYRFIEASNGKEGLQKAIDEVPALVLSDVMMPQMDGIEMCHKLKHDLRVSHIPLILLTAKATDESKLSGLETGADDYLIKPFNKIELLLKIRNQITAHTRMQEKIRLEFLSKGTPVKAVSNEEKFLERVRTIIEARLTDEQLGVETIAHEVGLSRSQLYRKITALTGISMTEFIRKLRLLKASELLQQHWGPVSQVAYEVGFSNLSYFSKVFKEEFGVLPSEYGPKVE